jgi:hypothetical protein
MIDVMREKIRLRVPDLNQDIPRIRPLPIKRNPLKRQPLLNRLIPQIIPHHLNRSRPTRISLSQRIKKTLPLFPLNLLSSNIHNRTSIKKKKHPKRSQPKHAFPIPAATPAPQNKVAPLSPNRSVRRLRRADQRPRLTQREQIQVS